MDEFFSYTYEVLQLWAETLMDVFAHPVVNVIGALATISLILVGGVITYQKIKTKAKMSAHPRFRKRDKVMFYGRKYLRKVFEGERSMTKDNHLLGKFDLNGIPPAPRVMPEIVVTFEIDVNGILKVTAEDKGTSNKEKITVTNDHNRLTPEDIERMIKDAERFAEDDKKVKEVVEARNELESYAYSLKNQINDKEKLGAKLSSSEKEKMEEAIDDKIKWLDNNPEADAEEYVKQKKELEDIVQPIISKLYSESDSSPAGKDDMKDEL